MENLKEENLKNYIDMTTRLVRADYHGTFMTTINRGVIVMAVKNDKIKFDKENYEEYKNRIGSVKTL